MQYRQQRDARPVSDGRMVNVATPTAALCRIALEPGYRLRIRSYALSDAHSL